MRATRPCRSAVKSLELTGTKTTDGGGSGSTVYERRPSFVIHDGSPTMATASCFTYETFTPELVRGRSAVPSIAAGGVLDLSDKVETMNETFSKVIAFLQHSGLLVFSCRCWVNSMNSHRLSQSPYANVYSNKQNGRWSHA